MLGDNQQTLLYNLRDARTARLLLDAGVDPNHVDRYDAPAIASARNRQVAQILLDRAAKVNGFKAPLLTSMLDFFAAGDVVDLAIDAGAEHGDELLRKTFFHAVMRGDDGVVAALIKHGADPNVPFSPFEGQIEGLPKVLPLAQACGNRGDLKTVRVLLDMGADPNAGKYPGVLLKNLVRNRRNRELIQMLQEAGARGVSELAFAVVAHDENKIRAMLAAAPAYQEDPAFWEEVLPSAAREGDMATVRTALEKGAPLALEQASFGGDALSAAAGSRQDEILAVLLASRRAGADPAELSTALVYAVKDGIEPGERLSADHGEKCVAMLLAAGAPLTANPPRCSPLVTAVLSRLQSKDFRVIEMLVQAGADPNPVVDWGRDPRIRLLEDLHKSYATGVCSAELVETVARLSESNSARK